MNEEHGERRRANDNILMDMHGMLQTLTERLKDHIEWDERLHEENNIILKKFGERIEPVEEFHRSAKTAGKFGLVVATPALLAIGAGLWEWIRNVFSHSKVP